MKPRNWFHVYAVNFAYSRFSWFNFNVIERMLWRHNILNSFAVEDNTLVFNIPRELTTCKNICYRLFKCIHSYIFNLCIVTFWSYDFMSTTLRLLYNVTFCICNISYYRFDISRDSNSFFSIHVVIYCFVYIYNCDFRNKLFLNFFRQHYMHSDVWNMLNY